MCDLVEVESVLDLCVCGGAWFAYLHRVFVLHQFRMLLNHYIYISFCSILWSK